MVEPLVFAYLSRTPTYESTLRSTLQENLRGLFASCRLFEISSGLRGSFHSQRQHDATPMSKMHAWSVVNIRSVIDWLLTVDQPTQSKTVPHPGTCSAASLFRRKLFKNLWSTELIRRALLPSALSRQLLTLLSSPIPTLLPRPETWVKGSEALVVTMMFVNSVCL